MILPLANHTCCVSTHIHRHTDEVLKYASREVCTVPSCSRSRRFLENLIVIVVIVCNRCRCDDLTQVYLGLGDLKTVPICPSIPLQNTVNYVLKECWYGGIR